VNSNSCATKSSTTFEQFCDADIRRKRKPETRDWRENNSGDAVLMRIEEMLCEKKSEKNLVERAGAKICAKKFNEEFTPRKKVLRQKIADSSPQKLNYVQWLARFLKTFCVQNIFRNFLLQHVQR